MIDMFGLLPHATVEEPCVSMCSRGKAMPLHLSACLAKTFYRLLTNIPNTIYKPWWFVSFMMCWQLVVECKSRDPTNGARGKCSINALLFRQLHLSLHISWHGMIPSIRSHSYYLFHHAIFCGFYWRVATIWELRLLNSVVSVKEIYCLKKGELAADTRESIRGDTATDSELKESNPFTNVEEDDDELEENELVLEDC